MLPPPKSRLIANVLSYRKLPPYRRLNVVPFVLLHIAVVYFAVIYYHEYEVLSVVSVPLSLLAHGLSFLFAYWLVDVDSFFNYARVDNISKCTHLKITPHPHKGEKQIVPLQNKTSKNNTTEYFFHYQQRKYLYDKEKKCFLKLQLTINEPFSFFLKSKEIPRNDDWIEEMTDKYGLNHYTIPIPSFKELYLEQALAPFFVFQVFCVCLWILDEYWYYAIFILLMLLTFEATVVNSRLKNLQSLRSMTHKHHDIQVYRNGKWTTINSENLLPGDICHLSVTRLDQPLPADFLLLSGSCITNEAMLTGESTPQLKECIVSRKGDRFNFNKDSVHILYSGTKIVQTGIDPGNADWKVNEKGCVCYTLRTAFNTSQGKLIRTILFSTQRVTANNFESFVFISFLLCFGIAASTYVLLEGLSDPNRSRYKLLIECSLIITSTVPPELPTEMSLAVNNSLLNLQKLKIFCTEPFRIPFAGKIDVCCFDKTGTLTDEHLVLAGVSGIDEEDSNKLVEPGDVHEYSDKATFVMAGCHSLTNVDKETSGDPMELATLYAVNWVYTPGEVAVSRRSKKLIRILFRHHFSSALSRMSTIVSVEMDNTFHYFALVKGSPEVIMTRLEKVPPYFRSTYLHYASQGKRVIAMACKPLPRTVREQARNIPREEVETGLQFCGFLVFECPLKPDSKFAVEMLTESCHNVMMITGDNPLTASEVAADLGITEKPLLVLEKKDQDKYHWTELTAIISGFEKETRSKVISFPFSEKEIQASLVQEYDFCVYGDSLNYLLQLPQKAKLLSNIKVIARATPENKTAVLTTLKSSGLTTLMCGDGTNDVGALKQANVGIALLNNLPQPPEPPKEKKDKDLQSTVDDAPKGSKAKRAKVRHTEKGPKIIKVSKAKAQKMKKEYYRRLEAMKEAENDPRLVNLGDASIASPFTAKTSSVLSVTHIIRQGRCTLIATRQMFSILALNCLIHAYGLSVLYMDGIKLGDWQSTLTGALIATCFMCITNSKPVDELSNKKPHSSLFSLYLIFSVVGQFAVHIYSLIYVVNQAFTFQKEKPKSESEFSPNLVNSAVFLITTSMQVSTFATNYVGHPYMETLQENKTLFRCLLACAAITLFAASELVPPFNAFLQLVPLPAGMKVRLLMTMFVDYVVAFSWERLCRKVFAKNNL